MKKVLFVHNNFPAQFVHVARALARRPDVQLAAIGTRTARAMPGVQLRKYTVADQSVAATHPFARRFDVECRRAEEVLYAASNLSSSGFVPDLILAHPGWGEALPLRSIFPKARIVTYCEMFYRTQGQDVGFDPEFPQVGLDGDVNIQLKNAATLLALTDCDAGLSPTQWQKSTFPAEYHDKIDVIHDGVNVNAVKPASDAQFRLPTGRVLTRADQVLTFVGRSFEPLRGFHVFMRALPRILAKHKKAQVVIVGGAAKPYGFSPPPGRTWRSVFFDEIADQVDERRIHFTGPLAHADYLRVLQVSTAHVYLTYPFVLSWSLLEAMSAGCLVIGSDTPPVKEVLNSTNGILVPFHDASRLANAAIEALAHPRRFDRHRARAREMVIERFDLRRVCLPKLLNFLEFESGEKHMAADEPVSFQDEAV
jgi:glycosyltransferase involved in cell wall biosynthesis